MNNLERPLCHGISRDGAQSGPRRRRLEPNAKAELPGAASKDVEARETEMAAPVSFSRWFASAAPAEDRDTKTLPRPHARQHQ
jgi:hypothetical protein